MTVTSSQTSGHRPVTTAAGGGSDGGGFGGRGAPVASGGGGGVAPDCYSNLTAVDGRVGAFDVMCVDTGGQPRSVTLVDPVTGEVTDTFEPVAAAGGVAAAAPTIASATLAQFAKAGLVLPQPAVRLNPEGDQIVQLPSWLWVDPAQWQPRSATATAGPVSATVTAEPQRVTWNMGTGDTVVCDGPGRVYAPRYAETPEASDCTYTYRRSSAGQPGASYRVTATIEWAVTWSGSDGDGGDLGELTTSAVDDVRVAEVQALLQ